MNYTISVIFDSSRATVIIQLQNRGPFAGLWNFPGGKLDPEDRTPRAGALRELKEETDINPEDLEVFIRLGELKNEDGGICHVFCGILKAGKTWSQVEDELLMWEKVSSILSVSWPGVIPNMERIVTEAIKALNVGIKED